MAKFVDVDARVELWRAQDGAALLEGADWVIGVWHSSIRTRVKHSVEARHADAIDNIGTKVELLKYCVEHNIKVRTFIHIFCVYPSHEPGLFVHGCKHKIRSDANSNCRYFRHNI